MFEEIELIKQEISKLPLNKNNHRRYPQNIKSAVIKAIQQGVGINKIAAVTGIRTSTVLYWISPQKERPRQRSIFKEVSIKSEAQVEIRKDIEILLISGTRILGLCFSEVLKLLKMEVLK